MPFVKDEPYNDLPLLPPKASELERIPVYKQLAFARAALAELKGRALIIPNAKMLINTLVMQEAKDSSSIENVVTSSDKLYRAFSSTSTQPDPQTKEVLRYRHALWETWQQLQKTGWNIRLLEGIYNTIKEKDDGVRDEEVYIGNPFNTVYTPPCCKDVLHEKLTNWIEFASSMDGIDPLIKMALLHYQFEAIHPFSDGNGRTGRVLNVLYISQMGLLDQPILYLSKYINEFKNEYYRLLREVTENKNWTGWLLYMLEAVAETAKFTLKKVNAIHELFQQTINLVKIEAPKVYRYELIETLFHQPYCKISVLIDKGIASRNTASKYLAKLEELGILRKEQVGNETLFLNSPLYELLSKG